MDTKNLYCTGEMGEIEKLRNCASHRKKRAAEKRPRPWDVSVRAAREKKSGPLVKKSGPLMKKSGPHFRQNNLFCSFVRYATFTNYPPSSLHPSPSTLHQYPGATKKSLTRVSRASCARTRVAQGPLKRACKNKTKPKKTK